jgi:thiamine biosynthesis lipoprotein
MVLNEHPVQERIRRTTQWASGQGMATLSFQAMGTHCRIRFAALEKEVQSLDTEIRDWVAAFEMKYSRFQPDSLVSRINSAPAGEWTEVDAETDKLFALCDQLHFFTRGAFDPTSLPLLRIWDWKSTSERFPTDSEVEQARALVGWRKIKRRKGAVQLPVPGMALDLGGIGKEYAVDCVALMVAQAGIRGALVDFGQDVRVVGLPVGKPFWHIGLEDPAKPGSVWCGLAVKDRAVATSGDYLRCRTVAGRRIGHIVDPRTGYPVDNGVRAVSVIAPSCTLAGALSTTAFVLGNREGVGIIESQMGAAGVVSGDRERMHTRNFHEYCVS